VDHGPLLLSRVRTLLIVGPTSGQVWVTTKSDVLRLDESGAVLGRTPFGSDSGQSWLVAF